MARIRSLFLLLTVIGPLHMCEQLATDIEEFHMIRRSMASYYALFDSSAADWATVALITIVWTIVSLLFYSLLFDGWPRLVAPGLLGIFAATELHHVVEAMQKRAYDAGLLTCLPYAAVGALLVAAVWRELRRGLRLAEPAGGLLVSRAR
jgi:hypothetical protein